MMPLAILDRVHARLIERGITENVQAHHDNYSKPLSVRWLCRPHHVEHHGSQ